MNLGREGMVTRFAILEHSPCQRWSHRRSCLIEERTATSTMDPSLFHRTKSLFVQDWRWSITTNAFPSIQMTFTVETTHRFFVKHVFRGQNVLAGFVLIDDIHCIDTSILNQRIGRISMSECPSVLPSFWICDKHPFDYRPVNEFHRDSKPDEQSAPEMSRSNWSATVAQERRHRRKRTIWLLVARICKATDRVTRAMGRHLTWTLGEDWTSVCSKRRDNSTSKREYSSTRYPLLVSVRILRHRWTFSRQRRRRYPSVRLSKHWSWARTIRKTLGSIDHRHRRSFVGSFCQRCEIWLARFLSKSILCH